MLLETPVTPTSGLLSRAMRHHLVLLVVSLAVGGIAGWTYASSLPTTYTSTTRVLVNPSAGNPFSATATSVRQDEQTSLETEAQMVRSSEVLDVVVKRSTGLTATGLASALQISVPPSTQILEITYTATDPLLTRRVTEAVATSYLANRESRFQRVKDERVGRLETQTARTVDDLRAATAAAQNGSAAKRAFNNELADALRNDLVNLRAQRSSLENLTSPAGTVIFPASEAAGPLWLTILVWPVGGGLVALCLGVLLALLLERARGVVRSPDEAAETGVHVVAALARGHRLLPRRATTRRESVDAALRRLRATILELDDRPEVISVTSADPLDASAAEALAAAFTRAGHRVVLVRPHRDQGSADVAVDERGLAQLLLHERLDVHDVLRPSIDPLMSVLDGGGFTEKCRELLTADRLRSVLAPLVTDGNIVIVHAPGFESPEAYACLGASDLGVVVVTTSRTRRRTLERVVREARLSVPAVVALVVGPRDLAHCSRPTRESDEPGESGESGASGESATGSYLKPAGREEKPRTRR